jgi:CHAT domain-containing protein
MAAARRIEAWFARGHVYSLAVELDGAVKSDDLRRLTRTIGRLRSLTPRIRHHHALYGQAQFMLAAALNAEADFTGDHDRIAESLALFREAAGYPQENPDGFAVLYAKTLVAAYDAFDDADAFDEAVVLLRAAPPDPDAFEALAKALICRADRTGDGAALDEAIDVLRRTAARYGAGQAHLLGVALCRRAELTGDETETLAGISALEEVIARPGSAAAARAAEGNLAAIVARSAQATGPEAGERAWRLLVRVAPQARPGTELGRVVDYAALNLMVPAVTRSGDDRSGLSGDIEDCRLRLGALAPDHVLRPHVQLALAVALQARARAQGGLRDLEEAAALLRETSATTLRHGDVYPYILDLYADVVSELFQENGDASMPADVIRLLTAADRTVTGDEGRLVRSAPAVLRIQLALSRGDHREIAAVLAATPAPRLPESGPVDAADWYPALRLVRTRVAAARRIGAAGVLRDAVVTLERLYQSADLTDPGRLPVATDLAQTTILAAAYDRVPRGVAGRRSRGTALTARQVADELRAGRLGAGDRVSRVNHELVREMIEDPHDPAGAAALARAAEVAASAAREPTAAVPDRLTAALRWAATEHHAGRAAEALPGYELAIGLLDRLAWRGLAGVERERMLDGHDFVGRQAAACAVAAGRPERAIELLEQGRAILLHQFLDTRGHDPLAAAHPRLAARLAELDDRITACAAGPRFDISSLRPDAYSTHTDAERPRADGERLRIDAEARMAAARAREELIAEIRALPGFADFLAPPRLADLRPPRGSAAVVVNTTDMGSHALIVTHADVRVVPLVPDFHDSALAAVQDLFTGLELRLTDPDGAAYALHHILAWLDAHLREPVHAALPADTTRLWWCPTGPAVLLPLHAALPDSPLEAIPASYTPTLRLLRRHGERPPPTGGGVLTVAPTGTADATGTGRLAALPAAHRIPAALAAALPVTRLDGADATADALLTHLAGHPWLHFAGHGAQDIESPFDASLQLADRAVTARDLAARRADGAELAMVAACETARTGARLADETATVLSALQVAGFRHAVGSLWPVPDLVAEQMTELFYAALRSPPPDASDAGRALHETVRELRARYMDFDPYAWAGFVHSGP